jgi:hypothetical protein
MERDYARLTPEERARYAYLRGMTEYRLGHLNEARHWLALADASERLAPESLSGDWKTRLGETLGELNEKVFEDGAVSLSDSPRAEDRPEMKRDTSADTP